MAVCERRGWTHSPTSFLFLLIYSQELPDIDALDCENPLAVTEYVNDIFSYWFRVEVRSPMKNSTPQKFAQKGRSAVTRAI